MQKDLRVLQIEGQSDKMKGNKSIYGFTDCTFDKRQTNIAKGIALLLLLWHHLFFNNPNNYNRFVSVFNFNGTPIECILADFAKVCVAIFLFLSGYGLFKSYTKYLEHNKLKSFSVKKDIIYVYKHIVSLLSGYWFIYIIFVPMGLFFGHSVLTYYGINPIYYIADFFGVSYLFFEYNATMNATWWFMSIIILLYLVFPLLYRLHKYSPEILLVISVAFLFCPFTKELREINLWLCPFVFGMYVSGRNLLERIANQSNKRNKTIIAAIISCIILLYLRLYYFDNGVYIDSLISLCIIIISYTFLSRIPVLNLILEELGKYSGQIFMFHTFIYLYYFKEQIYWFKYSIVIYLVMIIVCYIVARFISWLMQVVRYNKLINKLTNFRG